MLKRAKAIAIGCASLMAAGVADAQIICSELDPLTSSYQAGCLPPCACPMGPEMPLGGTLASQTIIDFGTYRESALTNIRLEVMPPPDVVPQHSVFTGRGHLTVIDGFAGTDNRLRLLLSVDGGDPRIFDSGFVRANPDGSITVADNDFWCYNIILHVDPRPTQRPCDPGCPCEYTGDFVQDVLDLLTYLDLWFQSDRLAEFDATDTVTIRDLLAYLDCWFDAAAGACP